MPQPYAPGDGLDGVIYVGTDATTSGRAKAATISSAGTDYAGVGSVGVFSVNFEVEPGFAISGGSDGVTITQV